MDKTWADRARVVWLVIAHAKVPACVGQMYVQAIRHVAWYYRVALRMLRVGVCVRVWSRVRVRVSHNAPASSGVRVRTQGSVPSTTFRWNLSFTSRYLPRPDVPTSAHLNR